MPVESTFSFNNLLFLRKTTGVDDHIRTGPEKEE